MAVDKLQSCQLFHQCAEYFMELLMNSPTKRLLPDVEVSRFAEFMDQTRAWQHDPQIWVGRVLCFIARGEGRGSPDKIPCLQQREQLTVRITFYSVLREAYLCDIDTKI
jgi:hypothetical protein